MNCWELLRAAVRQSAAKHVSESFNDHAARQ
nr:MAG TPA: hypothetical protein [Caudoviricetes sp.]